MALCKKIKDGECRGDCREGWKESKRRLDRLIAERFVMRKDKMDITGSGSGAFADLRWLMEFFFGGFTAIRVFAYD